MSTPNASDAGRFRLGGDIDIARLGYGAMRVTGKGVWGEPADRAEALRLLRRLPELGVDFIDTADSYGPAVSEELIAEALAPYPHILIATKGGLERPGPDVWKANGHADYLRACVTGSLKRLKVERIDLWQLHSVDKHVPREEQFAVVGQMRQEGLIRHVGLSNVQVEDIEAAQAYFPVASVQNRFNLTWRRNDPVLDWCAANGVGFIPWFPLAAGALTKPGGVLDAIAQREGATPSQVALAWMLKRSPVMLPIPGTSKAAHAEENVAATRIKLSDDDFDALDKAGRAAG